MTFPIAASAHPADLLPVLRDGRLHALHLRRHLLRRLRRPRRATHRRAQVGVVRKAKAEGVEAKRLQPGTQFDSFGLNLI